MATDWMGDAGTLLSMDTKVRHPNIVGDTNTIFGQVAGKRVEDGRHLVELDIRNENQAGLATALARVTVALPSRS